MEREIIKVIRTDKGIKLTVKQGVAGYDVIHSALMLLKTVFEGEGFIPINIEEQVDTAFEDLKRMYKEEYMEGEICKK